LPYIGIDCLTGFGNRPAISAASCLLRVPHFPFVCIVYVHCAWSVRARRARLSYSGFLCSSQPGLRAPLRSRPRPSTRHRRRSRRPSRLQSPSTLSQQKINKRWHRRHRAHLAHQKMGPTPSSKLQARTTPTRTTSMRSSTVPLRSGWSRKIHATDCSGNRARQGSWGASCKVAGLSPVSAARGWVNLK
jgi:hypothetical protein